MKLTLLHDLEDEPAVSIGPRTLSYRDLRAAAGAVAERLAGVSRAALWARGTLQTVVAAIAAVESGVELVPLNPKLGTSELEHILSDANPEVIIGDGGESAVGRPGVEVDLDARGELPHPPSDPEGVALIVYTSGTTGPPKGVLIARRAIAANLDALADAWEWTAADRLVHALPLFHVHGLVLGVFGPLRRGGGLHHLGRFSVEGVAAALASGDTLLFGVPTMYHRIAEVAQRDSGVAAALARARILVSGSAALPARTFAEIERSTGQRVVERYGLTETLMNSAVRVAGERRPGEVGIPLRGVQVRVVTDEGEDAPWDGQTLGQVLVQGPNLFLGYLNRPEETAKAMRAGWFWTGDLATRAPDGYLRIVGRIATDLIKTGGYKVGAGEVESALLEHPAVSEAAVAGVADDDLGESIAAWVVLRPGAAVPSARELSEHVAYRLAPHKRPRQVSFAGELPRNAMGKVLKQNLGVGPGGLRP